MEAQSYCAVCKRNYATPAALAHHVKAIHGGKPDGPAITFHDSPENLAQRFKEHKFLAMDIAISPRRFYCDFCSLLCNSSAHLEISTWQGTIDYYD